MIFPALVFLGLKNNDCCGCCGNESCGKRFAVSERKHGKKVQAKLFLIRYMCLLLTVTERLDRCRPECRRQSPAICLSAESRNSRLQKLCYAFDVLARAPELYCLVVFCYNKIFIVAITKLISERSALSFAEHNSFPFRRFLLAVFKISLTVGHYIHSSLQTHTTGCQYLTGFTGNFRLEETSGGHLIQPPAKSWVDQAPPSIYSFLSH